MAPISSQSLLLVAVFLVSPTYSNDTNLPRRWQSSEADSTTTFPVRFDARDQWPTCDTIGKVQDQGCCFASYTIAPTSVITDRSCIKSNETTTTSIYSAFHPLVCCTDCSHSTQHPCLGGNPQKVWDYWTTHGVASEGCLPYPMKTLCDGELVCSATCRSGLDESVSLELTKGSRSYRVPSGISDIQMEMLEYGPVQTTIQLYEDFMTYRGGVYQHEWGKLIGEQHVKLIGWGFDSSGDFWTGVNSFGTGWGENGLFRIIRGYDHLGVESNVIAGLP
ncbi:cathepsin B-like [Ochlerotatus camptorhynchus]|uniref:cathepsin B-like n=1 Tax=Ochlerotatus camptorhynchus TaxID=644619 RepID=UPI0031E2CB67